MNLTQNDPWRCACGSTETQVVDSRPTRYGIRRRRKCQGCGARFSTSEWFREVPITENDLRELDGVLAIAVRLRDVLVKVLSAKRRSRGGALTAGAEPIAE